jgi:hypothetical protein
MNVTISNPYSFTLALKDITVTWNDDKGHTEGNKKLSLQRVTVGGVTVWTGNTNNQSTITIPTTAAMGSGSTTVSFHFDQSYDNPDTTERVYINWTTPGCTAFPVDTND